MISILIPIYNYNVLPLVEQLYKQCLECQIDFEILCQDDASNSVLNLENQKVNLLANCSFVSLSTNVAHRENRNSLAEKAKYSYLLFVDGDSNVHNSNYIKNFIDNIKTYDIVYGGRLHPKKCPSNKQKLRWKYGIYIEDNLAINRNKTPYKSLLFNNTVIKKSCFDMVKFDKTMKKYGHDDTQLSYALSLLKSKVKHIDNQIEHGDIDSNAVFVNKMKGSLENLLHLYNEKMIDEHFVKLISLFVFLKKMKLNYLISKFYLLIEDQISRNLLGNNPKLFFFNVFRLGYLCSLKN